MTGKRGYNASVGLSISEYGTEPKNVLELLGHELRMAVNMTEKGNYNASFGKNKSASGTEATSITEQNVGESVHISLVLLLSLITFGILQNLVIVVLYLCHSKLVVQYRRWSMVFLALADMLLAINLMMSVFAMDDSIITWNVFCSVITVQIWTLCVLIMDRFLCVVFPFRFQQWVPDKELFLCCLLLWIVAFLLHVVLPLYLKESQQLILMGASWIPPRLLNIITFIWIQRKVIKVKLSHQRGHVSLDHDDENDAMAKFLVARKSALLCILVNALSILGPCNLVLTNIMSSYGYILPGYMFPVSMYMTLVSTVVNPWIHSIKVRTVCCSACCKKPSHNRAGIKSTALPAQDSHRHRVTRDDR